MRRQLFTSAVLAASTLGFSAMSAPRTFAVEPITTTFTFTGAEQSYVVPAGVTVVHVELIGGRGGANTGGVTGSAPGGRGARLQGDLPVVPGTTLYVEVGGNGAADGSSGPGAFNGGGRGGRSEFYGTWLSGGGGATDIRTISRSETGSLDSRLVVAAGGGGGGVSGAGGDAGQPGAGALAGGAGTAAGGGVGGGGESPGQPGTLGIGGNGAGTNTSMGLFGAGGGGGLYGGGGGGADSFFGGAGGGGSSYTGGVTNATLGLDDSGTPSVTISYGGTPPTSGTVSAEVIVPASAACLELDTTSVSFGTVPLGSELVTGTPQIQYSNCGGIDQTVFARGSDAAGAGAAWNLVDFTSCDDPAMGTDNYGLGLKLSPDANLQLSETNQELAFQPPGAINSNEALISTACPGSGGGGTTMSMSIILLATE